MFTFYWTSCSLKIINLTDSVQCLYRLIPLKPCSQLINITMVTKVKCCQGVIDRFWIIWMMINFMNRTISFTASGGFYVCTTKLNSLLMRMVCSYCYTYKKRIKNQTKFGVLLDTTYVLIKRKRIYDYQSWFYTKMRLYFMFLIYSFVP